MQRNTTVSFSYLLAVIGFFSIVFSSFNAYGSSYKSLNIEQVVNGSELVFEGLVIEKEYKIPEDRNRVYTYVTFEILDIVKGHHERKTITLRYPGGVIGDMVYRISDMKIPEESEHGIYFVKSQKKRYVHPLTGWSQGQMLVVKDTGGTERILAADRKPITAIRPESPAARSQGAIEIDESAPIVSRGVITSDLLNIDQALSVSRAKEVLKEFITVE